MSVVITYTGEYVNLINPDPDTIALRDISHSLAYQCRYNGHSSRFYSVAQHSLFVAKVVPEPLRLHALLHDAHEAYTGDIVAPIKDMLGKRLREWERVLDRAIADRFGFKWTAAAYASIARADKIARQLELGSLLGQADEAPTPKPYDLERVARLYHEAVVDALPLQRRAPAHEVYA